MILLHSFFRLPHGLPCSLAPLSLKSLMALGNSFRFSAASFPAASSMLMHIKPLLGQLC